MKLKFHCVFFLYYISLFADSTDYGIWKEGIEIFNEYSIAAKVKGPRILLIGARKTGTASLFEFITEKGNLCRSLKSEIHYFNNDDVYQHGSTFYEAFFGGCRGQENFQVDYTPNYFEDDRVPLRMNETFFDPRDKKLVLLLREPISRSFSLYSQLVKTCVVEMHKHLHGVRKTHRVTSSADICSASKYCKLLHCGETRKEVHPNKLSELVATFGEYYRISGYANKPMPPSYYDRIQKYLKIFDRRQIFIINFDLLIAEPKKIVTQLFKFLELTNVQWDPDFEFPHEKWNGLRLKLDCATRDALGYKYQTHNKRLYAFMKQAKGPPDELPFGEFIPWRNISCGSDPENIPRAGKKRSSAAPTYSTAVASGLVENLSIPFDPEEWVGDAVTASDDSTKHPITVPKL